MADLSKITLPSGTTYNIKDAYARQLIETIKTQQSGAMHYLGTTTTVMSDGLTTNTIVINGNNVTANSGDIVIYNNMEFIYSSVDNKWHEFGSTGSLKSLAFKENASGSYTPEGEVNVTLSKENKYVASSSTAGGSVTDGTAAQCTLPVFSTTVQNETLTLSWNAGSFTANQPTTVTMPTFTLVLVATGVTSATFTGESSTVQVS